MPSIVILGTPRILAYFLFYQVFAQPHLVEMVEEGVYFNHNKDDDSCKASLNKMYLHSFKLHHNFIIPSHLTCQV